MTIKQKNNSLAFMHFDMEDKCCIKLSIIIIFFQADTQQTDNLFFYYHPTIFAAIKESMAKPAAAP